MSFIVELFLVVSFFIFFFYGIVSHFSINKNFSYIFFGSYFLMLQIFVNALLLLNITILDDVSVLNNTLLKSVHLIEFQNIIIYAFIIIIFVSYKSISNVFKINYFEYYVVLFISLVSTLTLLDSNNFILFYILIEIQSISLYILTVFSKNSRYAIESSIKYFIMGSISSILLLLSITFIYGLTGFFFFDDITLYIKLFSMMKSSYTLYPVYIFTLMLLLVSLLFKMYSAPFHYWVADIYQASPLVSTFYFSTVYLLSISYVFFTFYLSFFCFFQYFFSYIYIIMSILSITLGTIGALTQLKIKKIIAYSSISSCGYFLSFFIFGNNYSVSLSLNFIISYVLNLMLLFIILINTTINKNRYINNISDFSLLYKKNFFLAIAIGIILFSISGIPSSIYFISKLHLLLNINSEYYNIYLSYLMINTIVGVMYFLQIIKIIFFETQLEKKIIINYSLWSYKDSFLFLIILFYNTYLSYFEEDFIFISRLLIELS